MGEIRLQVGPITSNITINDIKAQEILEDYGIAYGLDLTGTPQQKLDLVLLLIVNHIQDAANSVRIQEETKIKREEVIEQLKSRRLDDRIVTNRQP